ncbi:hypothetical protein [Streptomyces bikiniensis]|uniref:hypothetical protein n=1 Tax=Streptomyces bikiniensis TaxID=1896 RepID=UPI0004BE6E50|nr:hypothetical protein [Streptomyces bikiniensis]
MTSPQIQHCQHSRRPSRIEAPAITEMVAAMAHLKDALADPRDTAAFYTDGHGQHLVPGWVRGNADRLRELLDQLVASTPTTRRPRPTPPVCRTSPRTRRPR